MAEYFFKRHYPNPEVRSAGINVRNQGEISPILIWQSMKEKDIDMKHHRSTQLTPKMAEDADKIIVLCKGILCPTYILYSKKTIYWDIEDPKGSNVSDIRKVRDNIEEKVNNFFNEIS